MSHILKNTTLIIAVFLSMVLTEVKGSHAQTESEPFTVKNIAIDVTADSAKDARDKAFREAQEKSLPVLIKQLEASGYDTSMIKQADPKSIANAIKDFEISNEKISAVRYKGNFAFRYDQNLLSHFFYGAGYATTDYPANYPSDYEGTYQQQVGMQAGYVPPKQEGKDRVLVLPFFQAGGGKTSLWEGYNPWKDIWVRSSTGAIMAPIGDLADIRDIGDNEALTYNPENLARMVERYNADRVIILIGTHEGASLPVSPNDPANGIFRMSMYDTARGRPNFVNDIQIQEGNYPNFGEALQAGYNRSVEQIYELDSIKTIGNGGALQYAENGQAPTSSEYNLTATGLTASFQARIEYTSMQEWMKAQKALKSVAGISNLEVLSLTSRQAEVKVHFQGAFDDVATDMSRKGYNIQETSKVGRYQIYSGRQASYNQNGGIVYR